MVAGFRSLGEIARIRVFVEPPGKKTPRNMPPLRIHTAELCIDDGGVLRFYHRADRKYLLCQGVASTTAAC
jgi:hypothetical protein